jgi:Tol biopolymer transport system component
VNRTLVWVDRQGVASPIPAPAREYHSLVGLSPDGRRVALHIGAAAATNRDVWIYDLTRGALTRLTFEFENTNPIWTSDGRRITYTSRRSDKTALFWTNADGSGPPEQLVGIEGTGAPGSWTPDGKTLVHRQIPGRGQYAIWTLPLEGDRKARPLLQGFVFAG